MGGWHIQPDRVLDMEGDGVVQPSAHKSQASGCGCLTQVEHLSVIFRLWLRVVTETLHMQSEDVSGGRCQRSSEIANSSYDFPILRKMAVAIYVVRVLDPMGSHVARIGKIDSRLHLPRWQHAAGGNPRSVWVVREVDEESLILELQLTKLRLPVTPPYRDTVIRSSLDWTGNGCDGHV